MTNETLGEQVDHERRALEETLKAVFQDYRDQTGLYVTNVEVRYACSVSGASMHTVSVSQSTLGETLR